MGYGSKEHAKRIKDNRREIRKRLLRKPNVVAFGGKAVGPDGRARPGSVTVLTEKNLRPRHAHPAPREAAPGGPGDE